jgi:sec-independent protein translocase protein TatA
MFKSIGVPELILILLIVIIFFGVGKLPQVGDGIGKAIRNFKKASSGEDEAKPTQTTEGTDKTASVKKA